ncbi:hypothetical protein ACIBUY_04200 [Streptomyces sp. NPDC050085]|uniref:hypothetical protein n=1 Tax=Streptomyces sp. NPDC050085 TaxID=3365600 RepID=UPI0037A25241
MSAAAIDAHGVLFPLVLPDGDHEREEMLHDILGGFWEATTISRPGPDGEPVGACFFLNAAPNAYGLPANIAATTIADVVGDRPLPIELHGTVVLLGLPTRQGEFTSLDGRVVRLASLMTTLATAEHDPPPGAVRSAPAPQGPVPPPPRSEPGTGPPRR